MKVKVEFGVPARKFREIAFYGNNIRDLPPVFYFEGEYYDFIAFDKVIGQEYEYVVIYGEIPEFDLSVGLPVTNFDEYVGWQYGSSIKCECGAGYDRHMPQIHSYWCPKWVKV